MALLTRTGLRINRYCSMADFPFFKIAAVRHLGLLKVKNFNFRSGSKAQYTSSCQISRRSVEPFRRYGRFSIFKMAAVRHLAFSKVGNFNFRSRSEAQYASSYQISRRSCVGTTHEEYLVVFVTVHNLVVIGAVISIVCKF